MSVREIAQASGTPNRQASTATPAPNSQRVPQRLQDGARGRRPRRSCDSVSWPVSGSWKLEMTSRTIGLAIRNTRIAIITIQQDHARIGER